jgi:hypothetical protein
MGYLPVIHFDNLLFQLVLAILMMIKFTLMILGQSMSITKDVTAFTFNAQQSYLFIAIKASLLVSLHSLDGLQGQLFHRF